MNKLNKLTILWGFIIVSIFVLLTVFGFVYKNKTNVYKELEQKLVEAEKKYVDAKFLYPQDGKTLKTTSEELIDEKYLDYLAIDNNECTGYVEVKRKNTIYEYIGYIKCDNYKTKGYEE